MKKYDIVAFIVPQHRSILYRSFQDREQLLASVDEAISLDANVISIREVVEPKKEG